MGGAGKCYRLDDAAYFWDDLSPALATSWDKVNLLSTFGPLGGLLVTYALLLVAFYWLSRRRNASSVARVLKQKPVRMLHERDRARLPSGYGR